MKASPLKLFACLMVVAWSPLSAAETADIGLTDGRVFKAARIVAIGEKQVAIIHAGGMTGVPPELVPLDILARAHMALEPGAAERKKKTDALRLEAAKRIEEAKTKHDEEIQIRLAEASMREGAGRLEPGPVRPDAEAALVSLKAKFPAKRRDTVMVTVDGRRKAIEVDFPSTKLWTHYRALVQGTTVQTLPQTIQRIEQRIKTDFVDLEKTGARSDEAGSAQASKSAAWLTGELLPYLSQLAALR